MRFEWRTRRRKNLQDFDVGTEPSMTDRKNRNSQTNLASRSHYETNNLIGCHSVPGEFLRSRKFQPTATKVAGRLRFARAGGTGALCHERQSRYKLDRRRS